MENANSESHLSLYHKRLQESLKRKKELVSQKYVAISQLNSKEEQNFISPKPPTTISKLPSDLEKENNKKRDKATIVVLIPVWGRNKILNSVVSSLRQQTQSCTILCVVSTVQDARYCISLNADICYCPNYPLGRKYQMGVFEARKYNPQALMVLGSDDLLSYTYIEKSMAYIDKGYDFIGKKQWYIFSSINDVYLASYTGKHSSRYLGAGRTYSKYFLDKIGWKIFDIHKNSGLDYRGERLAYFQKAKMVALNENTYVFSFKGNWKMIHSLENIKRSTNMMSLEKLKASKSNYIIPHHLKNALASIYLPKDNNNTTITKVLSPKKRIFKK